MLNAIADFLIELLLDFKTLRAVEQFGGVVGLLAAITFIWRWFLGRVRKQQTSFARRVDKLKQDLKASQAAVTEQEQEITALQEFAPMAVMRRIEQESKDNNYDLKLKIARGYLQHHSACLSETYRLVMEEELARVEAGMEALLKARYAAWGGLAAEPSNEHLTATLAEIEAMIRIENKAPEDQDAVREQEELERWRRALDEKAHDLRALMSFGSRLLDQGHYRFAEQVYRRAERVLLVVNGYEADGQNHLSIRHQIALTIYYQGRYPEAEAVLRELLPVEEKVLGAEHPSVLTTRNNLAAAIHRQGKHAEAEAMYREVLPMEEKVLGAEHPNVLSTRNNLALAINNQGKYAKAEAMYREVLRMLERVLSAEHPSVLTTRNNLAAAIHRQGKHAEAEAMYREVLPMEEKVLGAEHPDVLTTRRDLASAINSQGKCAEAEVLLRELLPVQEKVLGAGHPEVLTTRNNLAGAIDDQGKYANAEAVWRRLLPLQEKILGAEHPYVLTTRNNLAGTIHRQGKHAEAEALWRELLPLMVRVMGEEHPRTRTIRNNLATAIRSQQEEAEKAKASATETSG